MPAVRVGAASVGFQTFEIRQAIFEIPALKAKLSPAIEVPRIAAHKDHAVDCRASPKAPPARLPQAAPIQMGFRFAGILPIVGVAFDGQGERRRHLNNDAIVQRSRLQNANRILRFRRQSVGKNTTGRTGPRQ